MMENTMKATNGYRRIVVSRNEVRISALKGKTENKEKESMTMKKQYQIINGIDLGEHQVVQCFGGGEITVFSITQCLQICKAPQTAVVKYSVVAGELFIKVTDDDKEYIYDEVGNLIEVDTNYNLDVVFSGCEAVIKKTSKKNGKESYYSFEGRLVG